MNLSTGKSAHPKDRDDDEEGEDHTVSDLDGTLVFTLLDNHCFNIYEELHW